MQILFAWQAENLSEPDALQHWKTTLTHWQQRYQPLIDHPLQVYSAHQGRLFLGLLSIPELFHEWQAFSEHDGMTIAWAGLSHNLADVLPSQDALTRNAALLSILQSTGDALLQELEGHFVLGLLSRREPRLRVLVNPYGPVRCFHTQGKYGTAVGTRIAPLLDLSGRPCDPNMRVMRQLFINDCCFDAETAFQGVERLPAGHEYVLTEHSQRIRRYCPPRIQRILALQKTFGTDFLQAGSQAFAATIAAQMRHARSPLLVNLSGGSDSRAIAATIARSGYAAEYAVSGYPEERETQLAVRVAESLGIHLQCLTPEAAYAEHFETTLRMWSFWTEGLIFANFFTVHSVLACSPVLRRFFAPYLQVFSGIGGDLGRNTVYGLESLYENLSAADIAARIFMVDHGEFFTNQDRQMTYDAIRGILSQGEAAGFRGNRLYRYFFWRETTDVWGESVLDMQQIGRYLFTPLSELRLAAAFLAMSLEETLAYAWHRTHLRQVAPELDHLPFCDPPLLVPGAPLSFGDQVRYQLLRIHPGLYRASRHLKDRLFWPRVRKSMSRSGVKAEACFAPHLEKLLFSGQEWWPTVIPYQQGRIFWDRYVRHREATPVWKLASLELWARNFLP